MLGVIVHEKMVWFAYVLDDIADGLRLNDLLFNVGKTYGKLLEILKILLPNNTVSYD